MYGRRRLKGTRRISQECYQTSPQPLCQEGLICSYLVNFDKKTQFEDAHLMKENLNINHHNFILCFASK